MHILLIHQAFASINEPGGTRHHEFAMKLAEMGFEITIIASPISYLTGREISNQKKEDQSNRKIHIIRSYTYPALHKSFFHRILSFFSFMASAFFQSLKIKNVDLVWGTSPPIFQAITAWLVAKLKKVPFLLEIRDLWPLFAIAVGVLKNKLLINLSQTLEIFLYKQADQIIVNSPGFINHISKLGIRDIQVFPNASDINIFKETSQLNLTRKEFGWEEKFVILYSGAHGLSNDLDIILKAAKLLEKNENFLFVFLGDGKEKRNLINFAQELELKNVQFLDPVAKKEVAEIILASDACVAILKPIDMYKTTYPNKVFDYMAAGKPIILAIDGVIRDVVEKAECGIFCEPGNPNTLSDAVIQLQENPELSKAMGKNGRVYVQNHFDRSKVVRDFADLLNKLKVEK